jgi:hypothetical protein
MAVADVHRGMGAHGRGRAGRACRWSGLTEVVSVTPQRSSAAREPGQRRTDLVVVVTAILRTISGRTLALWHAGPRAVIKRQYPCLMRREGPMRNERPLTTSYAGGVKSAFGAHSEPRRSSAASVVACDCVRIIPVSLISITHGTGIEPVSSGS